MQRTTTFAVGAESGGAAVAASDEAGRDALGSAAYAQAIEGAIAGGDAVALAYELGRLDASGQRGLPLELVESALRRLSVLAAVDEAEK